MARPTDRRSFLKIVGASLGYGALYRVAPALGASAPARAFARQLARKNGEAVTPFSFVQLSDTHVGFSGPPNPTGTRAFERAVELVNGLPETPDLVLFTGDLTHDTEEPGQHAERMRRFQEIARGLKVRVQKAVPGEHDAGLDGGALFRQFFGESSYSFDHRGVHFVALDNVSRAKPEVGPERIAWLEKDLAPMMDDLLSAETLSRRGLVEAPQVERMRRANSEGAGDYAIQLYGLLSLELWCRTFLDREWTFDSVASQAETLPLAS
jgi:hypothetical protein